MEFDVLMGRLELEAEQLKETIAAANKRISEIEVFLRLGKKFSAPRSGLGAADLDPYRNAISISELLDAERMESRVTQKDRVLEAAKQLLRDRRRRSTRELADELETVGVPIGGAEPSKILSTYLSRDDRFVSDVRKGGWTLKEFDTAEAQIEAALAIARNDPSAYAVPGFVNAGDVKASVEFARSSGFARSSTSIKEDRKSVV